MTLGELRRMIARHPSNDNDKEVVVWLPGSIITLGETPSGTQRELFEANGNLCIEGNVTEGSALRDD